MTNRGNIYHGKLDDSLEGYRELNWYDSRGKYLGFDIIDENGISIQSFMAFDE